MPEARTTIRPLAVLWGLYAWAAFVVCVSAAILCTIFVPGLERRRRWVGFCARLPLSLAGISTRLRGLEKIPAGDCVVVANHASYLDGVLLQAFLPPRFSYVIKGEMGRVPVVAFLLRRIGSKFVERFNSSGSARDARNLLRAAKDGESLALFPEGTFVEEAGLGAFRPGAFAAAIKARVPVVPVVIRGSRYVLPAGRFLPRHGHLAIEVLNPIEPADPAFASNRKLAERARRDILEALDEPDRLVGPES